MNNKQCLCVSHDKEDKLLKKEPYGRPKDSKDSGIFSWWYECAKCGGQFGMIGIDFKFFEDKSFPVLIDKSVLKLKNLE